MTGVDEAVGAGTTEAPELISAPEPESMAGVAEEVGAGMTEAPELISEPEPESMAGVAEEVGAGTTQAPELDSTVLGSGIAFTEKKTAIKFSQTKHYLGIKGTGNELIDYKAKQF